MSAIFIKTKIKKNYSKITSIVILFSVLLQIFSPVIAFAGDYIPGPFDALKFISDKTGLGCYISPWCWAKRTVAGLGYLGLQISSWFLFISANAFDLSAKASLNPYMYSRNTAGVIYEGWRVSRDFINLFFIFIILVIALSLILQIGSYGSKEVFIRLITIAFLINFSFFIAQQIITATNSAAMFFKDGVAAGSDWDLSGRFVKALQPQNLFKDYDYKFTGEGTATMSPEIMKKMEDSLKENGDTMTAIIIASVGGIAVMLAAAFILFAAAVLFILRLVVLWILIMLAPIAFASYVLPDTKKHWDKWWSRLLNEAFFAPVFMFLFYLVARIITDTGGGNFIQKAVPAASGSTLFNFSLIVQYIILLILLGMCLTMAKSMGASGADTAIKYKDNIKNWVENRSRSAARKGFYRTAAAPARSAASGLDKTLGRVPYVGRIMRPIIKAPAAIVERAEKVEAERKKPYENLSPELLKMRRDATVLGGERKLIEDIAADQGKLKNFTREDKEEMYRRAVLSDNKKSINNILSVNPNFAANERDIIDARINELTTALARLGGIDQGGHVGKELSELRQRASRITTTPQETTTNAVKRLSDEQLRTLDKDVLDNVNVKIGIMASKGNFDKMFNTDELRGIYTAATDTAGGAFDKKAAENVLKIRPDLFRFSPIMSIPGTTEQMLEEEARRVLIKVESEDIKEMSKDSLQNEYIKNAIPVSWGIKEFSAAFKKFGDDFVNAFKEGYNNLGTAPADKFNELLTQNKEFLKNIADDKNKIQNQIMFGSVYTELKQELESRNIYSSRDLERYIRTTRGGSGGGGPPPPRSWTDKELGI